MKSFSKSRAKLQGQYHLRTGKPRTTFVFPGFLRVVHPLHEQDTSRIDSRCASRAATPWFKSHSQIVLVDQPVSFNLDWTRLSRAKLPSSLRFQNVLFDDGRADLAQPC